MWEGQEPVRRGGKEHGRLWVVGGCPQRSEQTSVMHGTTNCSAEGVREHQTVFSAAAFVLAGFSPWELEAELLAALYLFTALYKAASKERGEPPTPGEINGVRRQPQSVLIRRWTEDLAGVRFGRYTIDDVHPVLREWCSRAFGFLTFRMVQMLTGQYLHRIGQREPSAICHESDAGTDSAQHTLAECSAWKEQRRVLVAVVGEELFLPNVVQAMVAMEEAWAAITSFCEEEESRRRRQRRRIVLTGTPP